MKVYFSFCIQKVNSYGTIALANEPLHDKTKYSSNFSEVDEVDVAPAKNDKVNKVEK